MTEDYARSRRPVLGPRARRKAALFSAVPRSFLVARSFTPPKFGHTASECTVGRNDERLGRTGVLTITLAATSFRAHHWGAAVGALIGGAASIGLMAVVNFVINSDFKWVLLGMALLWACSLVLFWLEKSPQRA